MSTKKGKSNPRPGYAIVNRVDPARTQLISDLSGSNAETWLRICDASPDAIAVLTEQGKVALWNRTAETMFGWKAAEISGKSFASTVLAPNQHETVSGAMKHFRKTGDAAIFERHFELS